MKLRYKRFAQVGPQTPHKCHLPNGHEYLFTVENGGVVEVPYQADVERMLNPLNGIPSVYELDYAAYGITYDAKGKEVVPAVDDAMLEPTTDAPSALPERIAKTLDALAEQVAPKRGRPRKS